MKKGIYIFIDENIWREFLQFVVAKHGKIKGAVGDELAAAIKYYMTTESSPRAPAAPPEQAPEQKPVQTTLAPLAPESSMVYVNTHNPKAKQKIQQLNQLITAIRALGPGARVSQKLLEKKMVEILGILTPPTRQMYLQNLILLGVLEPDGDGFYHVI